MKYDKDLADRQKRAKCSDCVYAAPKNIFKLGYANCKIKDKIILDHSYCKGFREIPHG